MSNLVAILVQVALVLIPGEKTVPEKCFLKCYGEGLDLVITFDLVILVPVSKYHICAANKHQIINNVIFVSSL